MDGKKLYMLFQGLKRLTKTHNKKSELVKGLQNQSFYTEEEMLATMLNSAEEGTFFICECFDFDHLYNFTFNCDDYMTENEVNIDKLKEDFILRKQRVLKKSGV